MKFLSVIGRVAAGAVNLLFGTNIGGGTSPVQTVAAVVDEYKYTDQEKAADATEDLKAARAFAAPGNPLGLIGQLTDGANHAMRPWITFELFHRLFGYREFPDLGKIDPQWQSLIWTVVTFWFGGRMLFKDLPEVIAKLRSKK